MAETENATKRAREGGRGPVKPDPVQVQPEQESEARARTLVELLHSESAAAAPPPSESGNGHLGAMLAGGAQRSALDGNGHGSRAVQPADLHALQRLAGNAAVADLMGPASDAAPTSNGSGRQSNRESPVQRAAVEASPPEQMVETPERKAAERGAAEAVMAWIAAAPAEGEGEGAESEGAEGAQKAEGAQPTEGAELGPGTPAAAVGGDAQAETAKEAAEGGEASPGANAAEGELGPGRETKIEAQETLEQGRAERAESVDAPEPQTLQLVGPTLGERLGAGAVAAASTAGPFALLGPIAGLVTGAVAGAAIGAAGERRNAPTAPAPSRSVSSSARPSSGARPASRGSTQSRGPGRAETVGRRSQVRPGAGPRATRSTQLGRGPVSPAAGPANAPRTAPPGSELSPGAAATQAEAAQATPPTAVAGPVSAPAAPPAAPPGQPPGQPPRGERAAGLTTQVPQAGRASQVPQAGLTAQAPQALAGGTPAPEPTARSVGTLRQTQSDPSRPSPADASIQPAREPSQPSTAFASTAGRRAAQAVATTPAPPGPPLERGFQEQHPTPGAAGAGGGGGRGGAAGKAPAGGRGGAAPRGGGAPRRGGGGGGGGGGAPAVAKPVPLGDAALEQWRSASSSAISETEANELTEAKEGPKKIEESGQEIDSARKGEQPDYEADAKEGQPAMPEEPQKDQVLDTGPAEAAVAAVVTAAEERLADQTFKPLGTPPPYEGLNPSDYVSRTSDAYKAMKDLEARLAGEGLSATERQSLTEELEARKKQVQTIGEKAQKGTAEPPPTVVDEGPASLEPPNPAMGDLMGDVIAREMGRVGQRANEIRDTALAQIKGKSVPAVSALGDEEASTVKTELYTELIGIADAAGVTEEQLKAKIDEQKEAVKAEEQALKAKLQAAGVAATKQVEKRAQDEGERIAGAKAAVDREVQKKQEAVKGPPDTEAINQKRDEFIGKVETVGAQALAGLKSSLAKRETALDSTGGKQKNAAKQAAGNQANAIRRHWVDDEDANKGMVEARPTVQWGTKRAGAVDTEVSAKKTASKTESDGLSKAATDQIKRSRNDVRDWAARQEGRERSWWEKLWDAIVDWGKQAVSTNEAWEKQRNADSRDKMAEDFDVLTKLRATQAKEGQAAALKEAGAMDAEQQKLANLYLKGGVSSIEFVARSTIGRIKSRRAPELAKKIEQRAIAELGWEDLGMFAQQQGNKGFSPGTLGNQIRGAVSGLGTDEAAVYAALGKVNTNVERAALSKFYQATYGTSLESDVKGDMSGRELDRALALKEGRSADANAAALAEALEGAGTDEDTVRSSLRGKSPDEIAAIKLAYHQQTGRELDADLKDDMEDAELDNALALSSGDQDAADAAELQMAMETWTGTDEQGLQSVYERIREQEEARAKREGLTPAEMQANIQDRNSKLKKSYNDKYGAETGGLDVALRDELDDADLGVMDALQQGDATKIDAAKANREHESWYADDDELEKITRNQHKQADLEVNLELGAEKARLKAFADQGVLSAKDYKKQSADWDKRYKDRDKEIAGRAQKNMGDLRKAYSSATNGTQTFDQLILQETQGYSRLEIQDLVAAGGKLSDEQELYYATAGVGTDDDKIKEIFKGKTPKEIAALRAKYKKNLGRDMDDDVLSDLSGRENLDVGHTMKYGDPDTFARQLAEAKSPEDRKKILADTRTMMTERKSFEETGLVGSIFAAGADPMNSAAQLEQALQRAEEYDAALTNYDGLSDEEKAKANKDPALMAAKAKFEMNFSAATEAQEQVRKQIDSYTDAAVQVGAAIAAVAVTIVTAGAAGPILAAAYGAAAAAAATIALKAGLKGAAYGWEELGTDVAIGAVDAAVSAATAGAGKLIMKAFQAAIAKQIAKQIAKKAAMEGAEGVVKAGAKQALKEGAKEGAEEATESAAKTWLKDAGKEAIEGAASGAPTAAFEAAIDDNTWKSGDPWGAIANATAMGAGMGAGIGVGAKAGIDVAGKGYGAIKGALKNEPKIDTGTPDLPNVDADGVKTDADAPTLGDPDVPAAELELPPQADPGAAAKAAGEGKLPPGVSEGDLGLPPGSVEADAKARADAEAKGEPELPPNAAEGEPPPGSAELDAARKKAEAEAETEAPTKNEVEADAEAEGKKPKTGEAVEDVDSVTGKPAEAPGPVKPEPVPPAAAAPKDTGVTPVEPDAKAGKPSPDDAGKPLTMDDLTTRYGMPEKDVLKLQEFCSKKGVILDVRPTTPHAEPMLRSGTALPKPAEIKAKTIDQLDVDLGLARPEDLGKVGRFRPGKGDLPNNIDELPVKTQEALKERLADRDEEWFDTFFDISDLLSSGKIDIDSNGIITNKGLVPGAEGKPFTGDHDLFDIRNKDGTALTPERYQEIRDLLLDLDAGIQHGSAMGWKADDYASFSTESGQKSYKKMMTDHSEGGTKPLVRLGDGEPQAVWHEPAAPPKDTGKLPSEADAAAAKNKQGAVGTTTDADVPGSAAPGPAKTPGEGGSPAGGQMPEPDAPASKPGEEIVLDTPEGTGGQLPGAAKYDPAENDKFFQNWVKEDPGREVGMLYNERTGEYVVFQGTKERVWLDEDNPRWMADLLDQGSQTPGDWRLVLHSHPAGASGVTPSYARWPSGGAGDWRTVVDRANWSGKRVEAQIQFRTDEGDVRMSFSYDPNLDKPYRVTRPGEAPREYGTIEEYHADFKAENGFDLRPIPDDFPGKRETPSTGIDNEPTQVRPRPEPKAGDTQEMEPFDPEQTGVRERPPREGDTVEMDTTELDKTQEMEIFDTDKTQEMEAFDPDKTGTWERPPRAGDTRETEAFDPDKTGVWERPQPTQVEADDSATTGVWERPPRAGGTQEMPAGPGGTQPFMQLPEGTQSMAPSGSSADRAGGGEQPFMQLPEGTQAGPSGGSAGSKAGEAGAAGLKKVLGWWLDPKAQADLRRGLKAPPQSQEEEKKEEKQPV